jgi:hypothetical protein
LLLFKNIFACAICAGVFLFVVSPAAAQEADSVSAPKTDSAAAKPAVQTHSPNTALIMSAIVPGLGQVYNRKFWKVPIIYAAGGAFIYYVRFNQYKYLKFRTALLQGKQGTPSLIDGQYYPYDILPRGRDYYRRYRDLSVLGLGVIYFLNIVDAMIDAHFFYYDVSDNLTMHIQPALINNPGGYTSSVGFQISIGF